MKDLVNLGVNIVAFEKNGHKYGMTCAWMMQADEDQLLMLLGSQSETANRIKVGDIIGVSALAIGQEEIAKKFGTTHSKKVNKFEDFEDVTRCANGCYRLNRNSSAYFCGTVSESFVLDTHTMFLVEVTDADIVSTQAPVTYDYYQKYVKQPYKPVVKAKSGQVGENALKSGEEAKDGAADGATTNSYICKICGYVYEGEYLPEDIICPICKHGAADFEKL